jgi:carboxyl-terminal processing protease
MSGDQLQHSHACVQAALADLKAQGASELVLDLSGNFGGLLNEAVAVARMFLPEASTIYITQGLTSDVPTLTPKGGEPPEELPLTVLVSGSTASAAEVLAGALKDNCRATIVGHTTFGKGLIQSVYELSDSSGMIVTVCSPSVACCSSVTSPPS